MSNILVEDTHDMSGLYPCCHHALLNDLGSFGSWIRVKLSVSNNLSNMMPSSFVDKYPHSWYDC